MSMIEQDDTLGTVHQRQMRIVEALLFASAEPLSAADIAPYVGDGVNVVALIEALELEYAGRGVNLVRRGESWAFRTAEDLGFLLRRE